MVHTTKALAASLVVVLAAGGVVATTGTLPTQVFSSHQNHAVQPQNVDAAATVENGTVTVAVVGADNARISNVTVSVDDETVGTTNEDGTTTFNLTTATDGDDLTITLEGDGFTASLDYHVTDNGTLVLLEESYEYARQLEDDD